MWISVVELWYWCLCSGSRRRRGSPVRVNLYGVCYWNIATNMRLEKTKKCSVSKLKKKLDQIFSRYIRQRDNGKCYTCGKQDDPKYMQNGHYVPRQYLSLRYSEVNCHCQCYACNMLYNGQPSAYALNLQRDYGVEILQTLEQERRKIVKDFPYEAYIEKYSKLVV